MNPAHLFSLNASLSDLDGQPCNENSEKRNETIFKDQYEDIEEDSSQNKGNNEEPVKITESVQNELQPPKNVQDSKLPSYNTRALLREANTYKLEKFERKVLIIFNQDKVDGYSPRLGTDEDVKALNRTFKSVGFEVQIYKDLKKYQILDKLRTFFNQDFTDFGCIAIAVLTHGSENGMLKAKDSAYHEKVITEYFEASTNPTLLTKPKILIVQACRGLKISEGEQVYTTHSIPMNEWFAPRDSIEGVETYTMPSAADQLKLHSTFDGNVSYRDVVEGSWFIQSLCKHINELAPTTDLEKIMVAVKKEVAIEKAHVNFNRIRDEMQVNKQMPVMMSTLIRKLYLKGFGDFSESNLNSMITNTEAQSVMASPVLKAPNEITSDMPTSGSSMTKQMSLSSKQYFVYLVKCLGFYLAENPKDTVAQAFLRESKTFGKEEKFDILKEEIINKICKYFNGNEDKIQSYRKYLFLMNNEFDDDDIKFDDDGIKYDEPIYEL